MCCDVDASRVICGPSGGFERQDLDFGPSMAGIGLVFGAPALDPRAPSAR